MKLSNKLVEQVVTDVAGEDVIPLIKQLKNKKNVSEFKLAEALELEVNLVRNMLYRLYHANLVSFTRRKDKKKGWYIYYWTFRIKQIKYVALVLTPFILNGIILTLSRGAFLGLLAGGGTLWRLRPATRSGQFKIYAILGAVLFLLLAHQQFWDRLGTITTDTERMDNSAGSRLIFMAAEWEMFKDHPFGGGHRAFRHLSEYYLAPAVAENPRMNAMPA